MLTSENKFQIKYIAMVIIVVGLVSVVIGGGIYYSIISEVIYRMPDVSDQGLTKSVIFSSVNSFLLVWIPVLFVIVVAISVFLLGRIASPLSRLGKEMQALGKGDFTIETESRKGEELTELVKLVNEAKKNLSKMILVQKEQMNDVLVVANDLLKECEKDKINREKVADLVEKMQSGLDHVQISLSKYRINK